MDNLILRYSWDEHVLSLFFNFSNIPNRERKEATGHVIADCILAFIFNISSM